ncbi:SulP family inorganic anion transporter [Candidiatus Paracoxiella cheracis]|uniref:SulP family inorganic anion transporter n=1 Tax=Candidiatus Paracoxiella cheracis TaxID=3405120 RepID=UPI003BF46FCB
MINPIKHFLLPKDGKWNIDFFSGLTVALALIPEAIAFALVAHVSPLIGLYSAFFMCLITALIGGRPGMISGAKGSMAVVIVSLVSQYGITYLFPTIVLTGLLQIAVGIFRLGKLIRILPKSVMVGFVNGLAIVIFLAQLQQFKIHTASGASHWLTGHALYLMMGLVIIAMFITHYLPRLTKQLPAALIAILTVTALVHVFHLNARVVDDMMMGHQSAAGLPTFAWLHAPFNVTTLKIIAPYAIILCIIGLSESLMTLSFDARHGERSEGAYSAVGSDFLPSVSDCKKSLRAVKSFESPCVVEP